MPINDDVKKNWQEIQSKQSVPVNAIGVPISANDEATLAVWKEEGIDSFMQK